MRQRRLIAMAVLGELLAGCASSPPPSPPEELNKARTGFLTCLREAANEMDDSQSDASSVAIGIGSRCRLEWTNLVDLSTGGMNPQAAAIFRERVEPQRREIATGVVLDVRKEKRQP